LREWFGIGRVGGVGGGVAVEVESGEDEVGCVGDEGEGGDVGSVWGGGCTGVVRVLGLVVDDYAVACWG